ncbi:3-deoxy-manno-octulosonate cytidylyltransferase [Chlorobium sp. BLA1]|uniref:3-deoxy-manno-octulosonate cytidylyltransferase n=1 Tax=Candidatus Chlorobium masyuteum TaxID=2716876 RepID=UPI0014223B8A|nr:3-deoxy-manno-octulosonate cytidylyltransferase [Candidatus Chlorobium masyuteum]NHQ59235.1 3-deoxy-manno-octulosonate cytidylyltransferase [Candidatus Chlorobium masyuteum]
MITVIIPARMASSRYPGKPLERIMGLPMVEHVRRRALMAMGVDMVAVATCDASIKDVVEAYGGIAVMTRDTHERCTDRVEEAMQRLPGDIVAMVQGDEPLLIPDAITQVIQPLLDDSGLDVVNMLSPLESIEDYANPDIVKAVCDRRGNVIYLTRAPVPYFRKQEVVPVYRQTGIMAFRAKFLPQFSALPETALENAESIDMLRLIEHGICIRGVVVEYTTIGVDRPGDVTVVESLLVNNPVQRDLFERSLKMAEGVL